MFKDDLIQEGSKISEMELNSYLEENSVKISDTENNLVEEEGELELTIKRSILKFLI